MLKGAKTRCVTTPPVREQLTYRQVLTECNYLQFKTCSNERKGGKQKRDKMITSCNTMCEISYGRWTRKKQASRRTSTYNRCW